MEIKVIAANRKARHLYEILDTLEAGIELSGHEVKSLRSGLLTLVDSFVGFRAGQAFLENAHIAPYEHLSTHIQDYDPRRKRRLLLHRTQIDKWSSKAREKGLAVIPLELYFSPRGIVKVQIALGRGKHSYDKRETLRRRDSERDTRREIKERRSR